MEGTFYCPKTVSVGPLPSPPLMAVWLRGNPRTSPLCSGPLICNCVLTPPGRGSRLSLPGPASTRWILSAGLTRPAGKPRPPYTLWHCCRSTRPRHWGTCTGWSWSASYLGTSCCDGPRLCKYAFPPVSLLAQTLCKVREDEEQVLLVAPYWPNRTWFPELMLLATPPPWRIQLRKNLLSQRWVTIWHPCSVLWKLHVWSLKGRKAEVPGDLPSEVLNTIASARALSMWRAYALKWNLIAEWCSSHREDPRRCSIGVMLSFLQQWLKRRLSPSTLKVHAAAIASYHDHINGTSVGKHDPVIRIP